MLAVTYTGTVSNCAVDEVYPRPLMIEGMKSEMPYNGQTIPDVFSSECGGGRKSTYPNIPKYSSKSASPRMQL
jgi:hypothetical protein